MQCTLKEQKISEDEIGPSQIVEKHRLDFLNEDLMAICKTSDTSVCSRPRMQHAVAVPAVLTVSKDSDLHD